MKKKIGQVIACALTLGIIAGTRVEATYTTKTLTLPKGGYETVGGSKSTNDDNVIWSLYDVYPTSSKVEDTYKRVKLSAYFSKTTLVSERVIYEGDVTLHNYDKDLKKGNYIYFKIRGNNPDLAAKADMYFNIK